jgi:hypothetical protein
MQNLALGAARRMRPREGARSPSRNMAVYESVRRGFGPKERPGERGVR